MSGPLLRRTLQRNFSLLAQKPLGSAVSRGNNKLVRWDCKRSATLFDELKKEDTVSHEIVINGSPEKIWNVLADVAKWPSWSGKFVEAEGQLKPGETLKLVEQVPGMFAMDATALVQSVEVNKSVVLSTNIELLGQVSQGREQITIEPQEGLAEACIVKHTEVVRSFRVTMAVVVKEGVKLMNEGLKFRVENPDTELPERPIRHNP